MAFDQKKFFYAVLLLSVFVFTIGLAKTSDANPAANLSKCFAACAKDFNDGLRKAEKALHACASKIRKEAIARGSWAGLSLGGCTKSFNSTLDSLEADYAKCMDKCLEIFGKAVELEWRKKRGK